MVRIPTYLKKVIVHTSIGRRVRVIGWSSNFDHLWRWIMGGRWIRDFKWGPRASRGLAEQEDTHQEFLVKFDSELVRSPSRNGCVYFTCSCGRACLQAIPRLLRRKSPR